MTTLRETKVLLVEDDGASVQAMREVLANPGYQIVAVASGEEALRRVLSEDFAVILLDVHLPGMDGFETAELIRRRRRSYKTPIIFLTGVHPESSYVFRGYEVGAVDYMIKPIIPEVLKSKIAVFVELYEKNAQIALQNRQLREMAQNSEQRFFEFVQGLDAIVWEGRVNHEFTFVSKRAKDILGYPVEQWLANKKFLCDLIHPDDRQAVLKLYQKAVLDDQSAVIECRVSHADGRIVWMRDHVHIAHNPSDSTVHLRGVMVDVTAQKMAQQRLEQQTEQLALADKNRNEFLAMLGHELRNPMAPIQNTLEWMRLRGDRAEVARGLETIGRQVDHMRRLVDDLLDVARITRGKIHLKKQRVDVNQIVLRAIDTARPLIDSKNHSLFTALAPGPVYVKADPVRLAQVIANLLNNAAKYTQQDGRLIISVVQAGQEAVIKVNDNGIGISQGMLDRVFDLFTQISKDDGLTGGGLGVGLTLVKTLVEMHGGSVDARSEGEGMGSEFVVYLPVADEAHQPDSVKNLAASEPQKNSHRILVVDDNVDAAGTLAMLLQALGHEVKTAGDGPKALELCNGFVPDLVFLDIGLPGMDGYEVARRMRNHADLDRSRLIALTGYGKRPGQDGKEEELFDHFLLKPANLDTIQSVLSFD